MTALEILKAIKKNPHGLLWLSEDRREAAYHDGEIAHPVDYSAARMARTDPALRIIDTTDGETLST